MLISSENATLDQKLEIIISLDENVILKFDDLVFKSDKMELFLKTLQVLLKIFQI